MFIASIASANELFSLYESAYNQLSQEEQQKANHLIEMFLINNRVSVAPIMTNITKPNLSPNQDNENTISAYEKANQEALERLFGCAKGVVKEPISIEEMNEIIADGWAGIEK